ncbi:hypothetical protein LTS15_010930 [Exophiala xenobiotica]|nr:hypothetical protein LTS15_010930 [Exophiala xenobiotica]
MDYARLKMVAGVMRDNWGQFAESISCFEECLEISLQCLDSEDEFIGGIYNDLGNVSESLDQPDKGLEWHDKAWAIRSRSSDPTGELIAHSKSNTARCLLMLDQDQEAFRRMDAAEKAFHAASAWFHEAQKQKDFFNARLEYHMSIDLLLNQAKTGSHVRVCACWYKLAAIDIEESKYSQAIDKLREALEICGKQKRNRGDRARVLKKLSIALSFVPGYEGEAGTKAEEAKVLYEQLVHAAALTNSPGEAQFDQLVFGLHR